MWMSYQNRSTRIIICLIIIIIIVGLLQFSKYQTVNLSSNITKYLLVDDGIEHLTDSTFIGRNDDDPALIYYVKNDMMYPPSDLSLKLQNPSKRDSSQFHQSTYLEENFLHGLEGGFYIEAGAHDGEAISNSLYFERFRGWKGLLVEPNEKSFQNLIKKQRKAYAINGAFSLSKTSDYVSFAARGVVGKILNKPSKVMVKTFPLYTMLLALGVNQVDFFSLDIEGSERPVLDTIPWDKIKFRVICMEVNKYRGGWKAAAKYFTDRGYTFLGHHGIDIWAGLRELLQETMDVDEWLMKNNLTAFNP